MNILIVAIFYLVLQLGSAEKDAEKARQEKGLKLEIPIENIPQLSALNIQPKSQPKPSVLPQAKNNNNNNGPGRFGHGTKVQRKNLNQNQPDQTARKGLLEAFLLSSLLSGNAGISVSQDYQTNQVCEAGCSAAQGSFSSGECFGYSPYYATDQCDCICKYGVQDDYTSAYDLCLGNNCQLYCQGLLTPDASVIPQSRTGGDLMFITGRCDYGTCYCCGRPYDYPLA